MYLIPKNIKIKREIFKGVGIIELITLFVSLMTGFYLSSLANGFYLKILLFIPLPLINIILVLPLPNGSTFFIILKRFIIYKSKQQNFKYK